MLQPFGPMDNATKASAFSTSCCAIGFGSRQNQSGKGWSEWLTFVSLLMSSVLARQLEIFSVDLWAKSNFPCSFLTDEAALKSLMISSRPSILRTPMPFGASLSRGFNLKSDGQMGLYFLSYSSTLSLQYNVHGFERSLVEDFVEIRFNLFS